MRFVILGAGAIGGVLGGFLARANRDVLLVARGGHLDAIRAHGLRVETPDGAWVVHPPVAAAHEVTWRTHDVLVLAVKLQDAAAALRELAAPAHVPIVCMTNGVEGERIALRHAREVYGGCLWLPATYLTPGIVQAWAMPIPGAIDVGRYPDGAGERGDEIIGELNVAGFASELRPNIMKWKRGKLLTNLANGAEALSGPDARKSPLAERARAEARACFAAAGLSCTTEAEDLGRRTGHASKPIAGVSRAGGSTWQSLTRGADTLETDYLNGEIVLLGRLHGVPTPVNEFLQRIASEGARAGTQPARCSSPSCWRWPRSLSPPVAGVACRAAGCRRAARAWPGIARTAGIPVAASAAMRIAIVLLLAGCALDEPVVHESTYPLVGPFRPLASSRSTRAAANLTDLKGSLGDHDLIVAPDAEPFAAEASAGVARGEITAAGVTTHESSLDSVGFRIASHCDANANLADVETESAGASCDDSYVVSFELLRPAKVTLAASISSFRTGHAGGSGEITLRQDGASIVSILSDNETVFEHLILPPGSYALEAISGGSANAFYDTTFSAVTIDLELSLVARNR